MFFSEEFIDEVEENPVVGISDACSRTFEALQSLESGGEWNHDEHELLWEASSFIDLIIERNGLDVDAELPPATGDLNANCQDLYQYLKLVQKHFDEHALMLRISTYQNRYKSALKGAFAYEFSQGDLEKIQKLINELREQIASNSLLEADHKKRLLKKLEKLQLELHKRVSDLDSFWGLVGDAGVVLGKLGEDAKPIVDRVRELASIVWKTQARAEELPSDSSNPVLEQGESE